MLLTDNKHNEALSVLQDAPFEKISNFIYKIIPSFMEIIPERTITMILGKPQFQIASLLPAILRYTTKYDEKLLSMQTVNASLDSSPSHENEPNYAIVFFEQYMKKAGLDLEIAINIFDSSDSYSPEQNVNLEEWVKSDIDAITLHTLCFLYAKYDNSSKEKKLCNFLQSLLSLQELTVLTELVEIDLEFLLRQCRIYQRKRSAVFALLLLKNYKQAVSESLLIDSELELSKAIIRRNPDLSQRKELWLDVAKFIIKKDCDGKKAVWLVKDSNDDIRIEVVFCCC
jgi:hypothetical protein